MEKAEMAKEYILKSHVFGTIAVIIISIVLYTIFDRIMKASEKSERAKLITSNKGRTYIKLFKSIVRSIFIVITFLIVLQINGINVSSVLAGVGLLGVVFGLAIQDWLKDIIRGTTILSDEYFHVGNIVKYKEIEGKVLVIGLKTTKVQDLSTKNIISIANRNIDEIQVVSPFIFIDVPMPYDVKLDKAEKAIADVVGLISHNDNVESCRYIGVTELADSSIKYKIEVNGDPEFKLQTRRDALRSVLVGLEKNGIEVPFTQIDVHMDK